MKKVIALIMVFTLCILSACGKTEDKKGSKTEKVKITIAYQYGMAYAPLIVMQEKKLIEKYSDAVEVEWKVLNSGAAINEGVVAGDIQVAYLGVAPFITAVMKGTPYKLYSGLSSQPMGLTSNDPKIVSLKDFKERDQIALVNIGSIQHIMLAMAAEKELGDAHALDTRIAPMAHPDGMQALLAGSVKAHLTTAPYFLQEQENSDLYEITSVKDTFPKDCSIIVGAASTDLYENHKDVYDALVSATNEAMEYITDNTEDAAKLLFEKEGVTEEVMVGYLKAEGVAYSPKTSGVMEIADFMKRAKFIEAAPEKLSEIAFDNVSE